MNLLTVLIYFQLCDYFFVAKVESVEENLKTASLNPTELREYCEKLFKFKKITVKKFNTWGDRRTYNKQAQQVEIEKVKKAAKDSKDRPAFPEGMIFFNVLISRILCLLIYFHEIIVISRVFFSFQGRQYFPFL